MPSPLIPLLIEARRHLGMSQGDLGVALGASRRTGQRWERGQSMPDGEHLALLAQRVHPHAPELATRIAATMGKTLADLGLEKAAAPASPPQTSAAPAPPPRPDPLHIVDTVVCAAAEAIGAMPDSVRPVLRAAFHRARLAGLSVAEVDDALGRAASAARSASAPPAEAQRKAAWGR